MAITCQNDLTRSRLAGRFGGLILATLSLTCRSPTIPYVAAKKAYPSLGFLGSIVRALQMKPRNARGYCEYTAPRRFFQRAQARVVSPSIVSRPRATLVKDRFSRGTPRERLTGAMHTSSGSPLSSSPLYRPHPAHSFAMIGSRLALMHFTNQQARRQQTGWQTLF
jgi:hypothetical protein